VVSMDGKVYWFGGSLGVNATDKGYVYDPGTGATSAIPDYPVLVENCCLAVARETHGEIYALAGDQGQGGQPAGYHRLSFPGFYDVGVTRIIAPPAAVDSGDTFAPAAAVENFGRHPEGFRVRLQIAESYTDFESTYVLPGETAVVSFTPWIANCRGRQVLKCSTMMTEDNWPDNNALIDTITVDVFDAGVAGLLLPDSLPEADFTPIAQVSNRSQAPGSVRANWCMFRDDTLPVYAQSESVYLAPRATEQVRFPNWHAARGDYLAKVFLLRNGTTMHDTLRKRFRVSAGIEDPEQTELLLPREVALDAPEPNPCRDGAVIRYALPHAANVTLKLYDRTGKCVAVLVQGLTRAGWHSCAFSVHRSEFVATPGVYFVRLQAEGVEKTRKVVFAE